MDIQADIRTDGARTVRSGLVKSIFVRLIFVPCRPLSARLRDKMFYIKGKKRNV